MTDPDFLVVPESRVPVLRRVDVLVCGGGVAGIAAAVAAARSGASTMLVERAGFLGGTATGSSMGLIVIPAKELAAFPREFFERLHSEQGAGLGDVVPWDIEAYKLVALDMVAEAGATPMLHTWVSEPLVRVSDRDRSSHIAVEAEAKPECSVNTAPASAARSPPTEPEPVHRSRRVGRRQRPRIDSLDRTRGSPRAERRRATCSPGVSTSRPPRRFTCRGGTNGV